MNCSKCGANKETFCCDVCSKVLCSGCSGVCPSEVRVLQLKSSRVLKLLCTDCEMVLSILNHSALPKLQDNLSKEIAIIHDVMKNQENKIENQMGLINTLIKEIKELKEEKQKKTYANVTTNSEVIIVKPTEKQESQTTKKELKSSIDPKTMSISVENIRTGREGAVIINCNDTTTKEKIKKTVQEEFGTKYNITEGKKKEPKVIIRGVESEFIEGKNEDIIEALVNQNDLNSEEASKISIVAKYKQNGSLNKGNIILSTELNLKNKMCQLGKVNIGWRRCTAHEYYNVIRCYKCARYGHMAAKCQNNITCFKCAESHKTSECQSNFEKCINCLEASKKLKKSLDIKHPVTDINCPCYRRIVKLEENKTQQA